MGGRAGKPRWRRAPYPVRLRHSLGVGGVKLHISYRNLRLQRTTEVTIRVKTPSLDGQCTQLYASWELGKVLQKTMLVFLDLDTPPGLASPRPTELIYRDGEPPAQSFILWSCCPHVRQLTCNNSFREPRMRKASHRRVKRRNCRGSPSRHHLFVFSYEQSLCYIPWNFPDLHPVPTR